ncbi:MAG: hypothetical protein JWL62_521, partial [Hyphomicrobiales bacterium]|nr:hypothetical protein [Hyphomicrobiales bacterium]
MVSRKRHRAKHVSQSTGTAVRYSTAGEQSLMLVYGDAVRRIDCHEWQEKLREPPTPGTLLEQHAERVARLIEGGQIAQALADAAFREAGKRDLDNAKMQDILNVVLLLAQDVATSWKTGFHSIRETAAAPSAKLHLPPTVTGREPEGYAFYALYPEAFFEAAREARPPLGPSYVIGIRSIGTSLAAMVAAGWATQLLYSVRPRGHPFGREISSPDLMQRIARDENATVGIVDEGPGLSGSSFAAVVNGLRGAGIPDRAMRLYPSHFGLPGAESSSNSCAVFANIQRHIMPIEKLIIDTPIEAHRLAHWVEDLTGPALRPLIDISGGKWRELRNDPPARWPACDLQQERRKYILDSERGRFLLKFIGLGNVGVQKAALAQRLSASGFAPAFLGLRHGFTVERWLDAPSATPSTRGALLPFIARYLGYRSVHFRDAQMNGAD